ncbi:MAG TPA: hypothetical protein VLM17_03710 [Xanthomonadaceae bacterium]|nr:hypothetical protein [Xanthomonadaceae bacterium]
MNQRTLVLAVCVASILNAIWFTATTAIPLPSSDDWFFIETFVRKALEGHLQLTDFFAQRFAGDHSQPLQRLVLLGHLQLAGLDFRIEALVGVAFGILTCGLLGRTLVDAAATPDARRRAWWGCAAIFAVGLSLNATMIYTWSLVGLAWISLLALVAYWLAVAGMRGSRRILALGLATFVLALVTDELAIAGFAAAVGALAVRDRGRPAAALQLALSGGAGLLAGRWLIHAMDGAAAAATPGSLGQLVGIARDPAAWKVVVVPLADSVVHQQHLVEWFPRAAGALQVAIAALLLVLHGAFWWRALSSRNRPSAPVLVLAVACMLLFYAAVAGILLSRVAEHGIDYLHQPRYVMLYALNLIALLLMGFGSQPAAAGSWRGSARGWRTVVAALAVGLVVAQVPLSRAAWREAPYVRIYSERSATALAALARDPAHVPASGCPPILRICLAPPQVRASTMALMQSHALNLFSARFRARYGLGGLRLPLLSGEPNGRMRPAATAPERGGCSVQVVKQGPSRIVPGQAFLRQPNGQSAFWLTVAPGTPPFEIDFEGQPVKANRRGEVVTFLHDERQVRAVQAGRPLRFELRCAGTPVGAFEVAVAR